MQFQSNCICNSNEIASGAGATWLGIGFSYTFAMTICQKFDRNSVYDFNHVSFVCCIAQTPNLIICEMLLFC